MPKRIVGVAWVPDDDAARPAADGQLVVVEWHTHGICAGDASPCR